MTPRCSATFRERLLAHEESSRPLEVLLEACKERGWLKARGQQRTDSTHVLAAIRLLNRLELLGETLRAALESVAVVAPDWLRGWVPQAWGERYGRRIEEWRLPQAQTARKQYAQQIGADGALLLERVEAPEAPGYLREIPAVVELRAVWQQH